MCERIRFIIAQAQQKLQSSLDIATVKTRQEIIITMDRNQEGKSNYLSLGTPALRVPRRFAHA